MRKWLGRVSAIVALVSVYSVSRYAYVAYRHYFHGPVALERTHVSPPNFIDHYGPAPKQVAELRLPQGRGLFPIAVLFHGGCWDASFGNSRQMAPLADALTLRGIATLNVEYRQVGDPGGGWPGTMRDAATAIDAVRGLATRYPLDPTRLMVIGHSAGAQLALWSAMRGQLAPTSAVAMPDSVMPHAVVAIDGPGTLAEFIGKDADVCDKPVIVPFMGGTPQQFPQRYRDASPQDHLPLHARQYFVQAALGNLMQSYINRATRVGDPVATYRPENGKHFDVINPVQMQGKQTIALILRANSDITNQFSLR